MSLLLRVTESVLGNGLSALLPVLRRTTNAQLLDRIPTMSGGSLAALLELPPLPGRDTAYFLLNMLRYLDRKGVRGEALRSRVRQYLVHPVVASERARTLAMEKYGFRGLGSLILTPTVACNLRCEHCYNLYEWHEQPKAQLSEETMTRVLMEAKELGAFRVSVIGGEPLLRWKDLVAVARTHNDVLFTVFTNGMLLTDAMIEAFVSCGNVELAFSIDGTKAMHDRWRGEGSFDKALTSMQKFSSAGGLALFAPTVTSENYRVLLSDEFLSQMKESGAYMGYLHHYDLVHGQTRSDWLLTKNQLAWMKKRIEEVHRTSELSVLSNVVSDLLSGGCPAIRDFVHINHKGQVEPCCMVPFAADSIHEKSLVQVLASPFFARMKDLPKDTTGVKRCFMGENATALQAAVERGEAAPTAPTAMSVFSHGEHDVRPLMPTCFSCEQLS